MYPRHKGNASYWVQPEAAGVLISLLLKKAQVKSSTLNLEPSTLKHLLVHFQLARTLSCAPGLHSTIRQNQGVFSAFKQRLQLKSRKSFSRAAAAPKICRLFGATMTSRIACFFSCTLGRSSACRFALTIPRGNRRGSVTSATSPGATQHLLRHYPVKETKEGGSW